MGRDDLTKECFEKYGEYNKILRSWFIAFGIGGPALFLTNKEVREELICKTQMKSVAVLFLVAVFIQVVAAYVNKSANWYVYMGGLKQRLKDTRWYKFNRWLMDQLWIDVVLDLGTLSLFAVAATKVLLIFVSR